MPTFFVRILRLYAKLSHVSGFMSIEMNCGFTFTLRSINVTRVVTINLHMALPVLCAAWPRLESVGLVGRMVVLFQLGS